MTPDAKASADTKREFCSFLNINRQPIIVESPARSGSKNGREIIVSPLHFMQMKRIIFLKVNIILFFIYRPW